VVAVGTVWNCWFCPRKDSISAVSHQSSVINPGLEVSDPVLEVGNGRCFGDIAPCPGCAASRPHEHTTSGAVPSDTASDPEVKKRSPQYKGWYTMSASQNVVRTHRSNDGDVSTSFRSLHRNKKGGGTRHLPLGTHHFHVGLPIGPEAQKAF